MTPAIAPLVTPSLTALVTALVTAAGGLPAAAARSRRGVAAALAPVLVLAMLVSCLLAPAPLRAESAASGAPLAASPNAEALSAAAGDPGDRGDHAGAAQTPTTPAGVTAAASATASAASASGSGTAPAPGSASTAGVAEAPSSDSSANGDASSAGLSPLLRPLAINGAITVESSEPGFPSSMLTRAVRLPDDWSHSRPGYSGDAWYRVGFVARTPAERSELLGLYIERVCSNIEVFLNGQLLRRGAGMGRSPTTSDDPAHAVVANNCNHPQLVALPASLIQSGPNVLDVHVVGFALPRVASRARAAGLSTMWLGTYEALAPVQGRQEALQVGLPLGTSVMLLLTGSFMIVMGWINRRESHLAYFGAACALWGVIDMRLWVPSMPIAHDTLEWLTACMWPIVTWGLVQYLMRSAHRRERWLDILLPVQCVVMALSMRIAGPERLFAMTQFWYTLLTLQVLGAAIVHIRRVWPLQRRRVWPVVAAIVVIGAAQALGFIGWTVPLSTFGEVIMQALPPLTLLLMALNMIHEHGTALQKSEADRADLERHIAIASAEIERNYQQLSELRVEQVTERERKRIAGDLHDDLGAKLLTIVHTSESDRISNLARDALEEMRLSVRGLTGRPVRLDDALADWRSEVMMRLEQAGIEPQWTMPFEDLPQTLSSRAYVQTTRILREAVSNVIKHSRASQCVVRASVEDGDFLLIIQDNGEGVKIESDGRLDRGHGLSSMKHRAKQMQGQCLVESGPGYGTVIRLTIPLDHAVEMSTLV